MSGALLARYPRPHTGCLNISHLLRHNSSPLSLTILLHPGGRIWTPCSFPPNGHSVQSSWFHFLVSILVHGDTVSGWWVFWDNPWLSGSAAIVEKSVLTEVTGRGSLYFLLIQGLSSGWPPIDYVAKAGLELWSSWLRVLRAGITVMCHHTWFI